MIMFWISAVCLVVNVAVGEALRWTPAGIMGAACSAVALLIRFARLWNGAR